MSTSTIQSAVVGMGGELIERPYIRVVYQSGFPSQVGINGCRVEDVIDVAIQRLNQYQEGTMACVENESALQALGAAKRALLERTLRRQEQGVYHTMQQHKTIRTEDLHEDFSATGA